MNASRNPTWHPGWRLILSSCSFLQDLPAAARVSARAAFHFKPVARVSRHAASTLHLILSMNICLLLNDSSILSGFFGGRKRIEEIILINYRLHVFAILCTLRLVGGAS